MQPQMTPKDTIKHALISIIIGAIISFLTVLFQESIKFLNNVQPEVPGVLAGVGKYLHSWKSNLNA